MLSHKRWPVLRVDKNLVSQLLFLGGYEPVFSMVSRAEPGVKWPVFVPAPPLILYVFWGNLFNLCVPRFPQPQNEDDNSTYLTG